MRKSAVIVIIVLTAIAIAVYCQFHLLRKPQGQENCERIKRQVKLSVKYKNIYDYPCIISLKIPLLKDWPYRQKVHSLAIKPSPQKQIEDELGNSYLQYDNLIVKAGQTFTVEQQATIDNDALVFNFNKETWEDALPNLYETKATLILNRDYWHSALAASSSAEEKQLANLARQITEDQQYNLYKLLAIYDFMRQAFAYDSKQAKNSFTDMLKDKHLQCSDSAMLTAKLLQNLGFRVRIAGGMLLSTSEPEDQATHSWCEVFCPDLGYVPIDPTQGRFPYMRQSCFAKADPNIVVWYIGDDSRGCALKEKPAPPSSPKKHPSQLHTNSLSVNISHRILDYNSNLSDNRVVYNFGDFFALKDGAAPKKVISGSEVVKIETDPNDLSQAALWALHRRWSNDEIKALSSRTEPAAKLLQAWLAIYNYNWQKAQNLLDELPEDNKYVAEAKAFLAIFTMQSLEVKKQMPFMQKCPARDFMAEAICQFCSDQRSWLELCWAGQASSCWLPTNYILKIQWLRGAFKTNQPQEQKLALAALAKSAPQDGYPYLTLGQLYLERGQIDESLIMLQKASELSLRPEEKKFVRNLKKRLRKVQQSDIK